ncbi:T9SS type A sorting domain-containing protein, partial [candidate division KSB1 bacterium]|nr:T9SS type A sorting domain-containing protein [candidate division KSB1 bacterium]
TATTDAATSITASSATLNGIVNANSDPTTVTFEYGMTDSYGTSVSASPSPVTGSTDTNVNKAITGLTAGLTYHYRVNGTNAGGTTNGDDKTFSIVSVAFTDGNGFSPVITPDSENQALGRFHLTVGGSGVVLTDAAIKLNGTRTGLSNLKLWSSTDDSFNSVSDVQLGSTVASDPGDGNSVEFTGFSSAISTGTTWYFLTGDISAAPSGTVRGLIVNNTSLTFSSGYLSGTISNAVLSDSDISLPVGLVSFSAHAEGRSVILNWITESEVDNLGFILDRSVENDQWVEIASYQTNESLKGRGNTSNRTEYSYPDVTVELGKTYAYRLSDVSTTGEITVHPSLSIRMDDLAEETKMKKAYPNPFNPQTYISYQLQKDTDVKISVFDMLGRFVKTLYDGYQSNGSYHVFWNGANETGVKVHSGIYIIRMRTETVTQVQKVMLMK